MGTSMGRDVASAYAASAAKVISWVVVSAWVFRWLGPGDFALLALVRGTLGVLNYTTLGLGPALIHTVARAEGEGKLRGVFSNGMALAGAYAGVGLAVVAGCAWGFGRVVQVSAEHVAVAGLVVGLIGAGTVLRLAGDAAGAFLQARGRIAEDNGWLALTEAAWVALSGVMLWMGGGLVGVGWAYVGSGAIGAGCRGVSAGWGVGWPRWGLVDGATVGRLLGFGGAVMAAQVADYLYAPADYLLINQLIDPKAVAVYAPALQIDSGLLLLVSAMSAVLLPKSALAHAAGEIGRVRTYFVNGTLLSLGVLGAASAAVWVGSPWIFRLWLGRPMEQTQAILPLVLLHTTLGGASGVGRSVLLAMGRTRAVALSAWGAGLANVVLGFVLVRYAGLGLHGIVLGTIVAVFARCVVWMPWYVLRTLGRAEQRP